MKPIDKENLNRQELLDFLPEEFHYMQKYFGTSNVDIYKDDKSLMLLAHTAISKDVRFIYVKPEHRDQGVSRTLINLANSLGDKPVTMRALTEDQKIYAERIGGVYNEDINRHIIL